MDGTLHAEMQVLEHHVLANLGGNLLLVLRGRGIRRCYTVTQHPWAVTMPHYTAFPQHWPEKL